MKLMMKRILLCILVIMSICFLTACKKKNPNVDVFIKEQNYFAGDVLKDIELIVDSGKIPGGVFWQDEDYVLVEGENEVNWKFVPENTKKYAEVSGTLTISALPERLMPIVNPIVTTETIYSDKPLSTIELSLSLGDTAGVVWWKNNNQLTIGGTNSYEWRFIPADNITYKEITGTIEFYSIPQQIVSLEYLAYATKTEYKAYEEFDSTGMIAVATYDQGKVVNVTNGFDFEYQNGESFRVGDTSVTIIFEGLQLTQEVTVLKKQLQTPAVVGSYVYNGNVHMVEFSENGDLFEPINNNFVDAGTHKLELSILDFENIEWADSETQIIQVDFIISKATQVIVHNNSLVTFDNQNHTSTIYSENAEKIYYSSQQLNLQNYLELGAEQVNYKNAGEYIIYYYCVGTANYLDSTGSITLKINKASIDVKTKDIYALQNEKNANLSASYVMVCGVNNTILEGLDISFKYYTTYVNSDEKVETTTESGATANGLAPRLAGVYFVETIVAESDNYLFGSAISKLVISDEDCKIAKTDELNFGWRYYYLQSNSESVSYYIEVEKVYNGDILELKVNANFNGTILVGRLVKFEEEYEIEFEHNTYKVVLDERKNSITLYDSDNVARFENLKKFIVPNYIGEYTRQDTNKAKDYLLKIYVDGGTIVFELSYTKLSDNIVYTKKGKAEYSEDNQNILFVQDNGVLFVQVKNFDINSIVSSLNIIEFPTIYGYFAGEYTKK